MRVLQILLLFIIAVCVKTDGEPFDNCTEDDECPQNATCNDLSSSGQCECDEEFIPYDSPVEFEGDAMIFCTRRYLCMQVY